ncbi:MAG: VWA domain-containing protein [Candidatus Acidiferrales bacterium]
MAAIAACSLALLAAQAPNSSSPAASQAAAPPSVISVQSNLVLVRVVVRDAHGNAVSGLAQNDFQLFDNGKPQAIAYFSAENAANGAVQPAPAETPAAAPTGAQPATAPAPGSSQHYTALFFDDYHLQFAELARTRDAAQRFLVKALGAGDSVGIFTPSGRAEIDFTTDADKLQKALAQLRIAANSAGGECPNLTAYHAQLFLDDDPVAVQDAINMTAQCVCGGPPSSCPPGTNLPIIAQMTARNVLALSDVYAENTLGALQNLVRRMGQLPGEHGIALISDGFENRAHQDRLNQIIDGAIHNNVVISAMAGYGLKAYVPGGDASQSAMGASDPALDKAGDDSAAAVVAGAAEGTGGVFIRDTNDFDGGFERIGGVAEASYVLGFAPPNLKYDGSFHKIKASVIAHPNFTIQARLGYFATQPAQPALSPEMQEEASFKAILDATDPDAQIRLAKDFLATHPDSRFAGPVSNRLVETYYSKQDWLDFYAAAATSLAKNPDDVDILVLTGWVIAHLYDPNDSGANAEYDQAENYLKHAIEIIPSLPKPPGLSDVQFSAYKTTEMMRAHSGLGLVEFRRRDFTDSVAELQQANLGVTSPDPTDLWALGIGLQQLKRYADASDAFEKCGESPGSLHDPCMQLARQAEKAEDNNSMWSPPNVDAPLKSISTTQTCSLTDVLSQAGERAQELVDNLQRFAAKETIQLQQLNSMGMLVGSQIANYDYLVTFEQAPNAFVVDESRQVSAGGRGLAGGPRDNGLTALALIFHPYYQGDYDMRCEGAADWNGTPAWVIHFVQRKDKPGRTQGIDTPQRQISLKLKGIAWIAQDSFQVLHIETNLAEPVAMLGLTNMATSITYAPVDFHNQNVQLWLPQSAETFTEMMNGRAVVKHTFTDFVLFSVQSNQTIEKPQQPQR